MAKKQTKTTPSAAPTPNLPRIPGFIGRDIQVAADADGELYKIDCNNGTISKLRWE
jgi:hypothetical protein